MLSPRFRSPPSPMVHRLRRPAEVCVQIAEVQVGTGVFRILLHRVLQHRQLFRPGGEREVSVRHRRPAQPLLHRVRILLLRREPGKIVHRQRTLLRLRHRLHADA
jgi:hypothetical protein